MKDLCVFAYSLVLHSVVRGLPALILGGAILMTSLPLETARAFAHAAPLAYVTQRDAQPDESDLCPVPGAVSVIDTTTNQVVATVLGVGPGPNGMAVASNGKRAYVANYGNFPSPFAQATCLSDTVSVLKLVNDDLDADEHSNVNPPKVVATVKVGIGPIGLAITPFSNEVYVTNFGQDPDLVPGGVPGNTVSVINTRRNEVVATIPVGNLPAGVAITPGGRRAYVAVRGEDKVSVLDTVTRAVVDTIAVQDKPANVAITPNGRRAYVTNFGSNSVSVIDTATNTVVQVPDGEAIRVGFVPIGLAIPSNGARVYVVNAFSNNVSVIDTATNTVIATVNVGQGPRAVAITPNGAHAYVTNFLDDTLSVLDTATNEVVDTLPLTGGPNWVTIPGRHGKAHEGGQ